MRRMAMALPPMLALLAGCNARAPVLGAGAAPASGAPDAATVYAPSDGTEAWNIRGNRFWSGSPGVLRPDDRPESVTRWQAGTVACVSLNGVMIFGAPERVRKGDRFRCDTARFEVADCDAPDDCRNSRIVAYWRTGLPPDYAELPVNYYYNRCRGIQSITFSLERPPRDGFGSTLELRQGPGLLAQGASAPCPALGEETADSGRLPGQGGGQRSIAQQRQRDAVQVPSPH